MRFKLFLGLAMIFFSIPVSAGLKAPAKTIQGKLVNDLPAPFNVQAVIKNRSVALQWEWQPPEQQPLFTDFGYEILRQDGINNVVTGLSFVDLHVEYGTYTYKIRVRGSSKEHGQRLNHVSSWSEPVEAIVRVACEGVPRIELKVEPTQKLYNAIPSLRMHLSGRMTQSEGCSLKNPMYKIDAETGSSHTGTLQVDSQGRFNESVDAIGPEDEVPSGDTSFTVSVSAENEAGPATSNAYAVGVHLQNKFAPKNSASDY